MIDLARRPLKGCESQDFSVKEKRECRRTSPLRTCSKSLSNRSVGRDAFGTTPVRPAFWAYLDTDLLPDLEAVANFAHSSQYANQQSVLDSELNKKTLALTKSLLIGLETYGESYGDRAQAEAEMLLAA